MKILFTHCYSKANRGDAAIVSVMLERVKRLIPDAEIKLVTMDNIAPNELFEGAAQLHSFFYAAVYASKSAFGRMYNTLRVFCATLFWACGERLSLHADWILPRSVRTTALAYKSADALVAVGGGYLLSKNNLHDTVSMLLQLHALLIGALLKKPVILFSQSIGPFGNALQRMTARAVLQKTEAIYAREALTLQYVRDMHIQGPEVVLTADAAFLFCPQEISAPDELLRKNGGRFVGITVRNWFSGQQQREYEQAMTSFARFLVGQGFTPVFIPQVTSDFHNDNDSEVTSRIVRLLGSDVEKVVLLPDTLDYKSVRSAVSVCEYVVGTRMHSVIFALTANVPSLAIAYERKTLGIMQELGLKEYVVPMEHVTFELLKEKFEQLVRGKESYLSTLAGTLPEQQRLAESAFERLAQRLTDNAHV